MNYNLLTTYIRNYLEDVKLFKSKNTYIDEFFKLKAFVEFCNEIKDFEISKTLILEYINYLHDNNNSNYTINKKVKSINRMLTFNNLSAIDIKNLKYRKVEQSYLNENELNQIKKYIEYNPRFKNEYDNMLDKAILNFLIDTGCRASESCNLFVSEIDFSNNKAVVYQQKTYSEKKVYFTDKTCFYLSYLSHFNNQYVFLNSRTNEVIDRFYITRLCKYISKGTGIEFHPHTFRHSCATSLIINGCPITSVQRILGHSDIKTTMNYLHIIDDVIENDYRKYRG